MLSPQDALQKIAGQRVVLVGDLMLDTYIHGEAVRVSREAPVPIIRKEYTEYRLGGAANTAANLLSLGLSTTLVGGLGEGDSGARLLNELNKAGADCTYVVQNPSLVTPVKTRVLAGSQGTMRQQVLRIDEEQQEPINEEVLKEIAQGLQKASEHCDFIIVSDYGLGVVSGVVLDRVLSLAASGVAVFVDSRYQLSRFKGVAAVTPNLPEAQDVVGFTLNNKVAVERAGRQIKEQLNCDCCLLTQGRGGMSLFLEGMEAVHIPIVGEEEVTDVTGAGDTVMATFASATSAGLGRENAMILANLAAGLVVTRLGAVPIDPVELIEFAHSEGLIFS